MAKISLQVSRPRVYNHGGGRGSSRFPLAAIERDSGHHILNWAGNAARIFGGDAPEVLGRDASKFTERGRVKISAVRVAVADTGIGIKAEHTGMLFEAFRELDGSAKRIYEGTDHHEDSQCR